MMSSAMLWWHRPGALLYETFFDLGGPFLAGVQITTPLLVIWSQTFPPLYCLWFYFADCQVCGHAQAQIW
jgi:hypothetical protein